MLLWLNQTGIPWCRNVPTNEVAKSVSECAWDKKTSFGEVTDIGEIFQAAFLRS